MKGANIRYVLTDAARKRKWRVDDLLLQRCPSLSAPPADANSSLDATVTLPFSEKAVEVFFIVESVASGLQGSKCNRDPRFQPEELERATAQVDVKALVGAAKV